MFYENTCEGFIEIYVFLYIFYLPVDWLNPLLLQKRIRPTEVFTAKKPSVRGQWAGMRSLQYKMLRIIQHRTF